MTENKLISKNALSLNAIQIRLIELDNWVLKKNDHQIYFIEKVFHFEKYLNGIQFTSQIAHKAEEIDHHPDILIQWCKITIQLSTHSLKGLTDKDFSFAIFIDKLL